MSEDAFFDEFVLSEEASYAAGIKKHDEIEEVAYITIDDLDEKYVKKALFRYKVLSHIKKRIVGGWTQKKLEPIICYHELATRYAKNILSAEWLWRNRIAREVTVEVSTSNLKNYSVKDAQYKEWSSSWGGKDLVSLEGFTAELEGSLSCQQNFLFADVIASIKTEFCQEIFPSQLFVDKDDKDKVSAARQFMKSTMVDGRKAVSLGAYKVGAAIQKIDDWWLDEGAEYPLRVSEYGADRSRVLAMREPTSKTDFYSLLGSV